MLNKKKLGVLISVLVAANLSANEPKQIDYEFEMIQKTIPKTKIVKYKKSILDGFYNVYFENGNMVYVNPFKNLILFGEILTSTGNSIRATEREQWKKELADGGNIVDPQERVISELKKTTDENKKWNMDLVSNGIVDGKGGNKNYKDVIVESPTCPHCNSLNKYLETFENTTYRYLSNVPLTKKLYKDKYGIAEPDKKLQEQGDLIASKIKGIGVPFGIVIDENNNIVETIIGFSDQNKTSLETWDKYLK